MWTSLLIKVVNIGLKPRGFQHQEYMWVMEGSTRAGVGPIEEAIYTNKSSSSPWLANSREKRKQGSLKRCNISRHDISSKMKYPFKMRKKPKRNALQGLWIKIKDIRTNNLNKSVHPKTLAQ